MTPLSGGDASLLCAWQNDPALRDLIMGFRGPVSLETTEGWLRDLAAQNLSRRVVFGVRRDGALAGVAQLQAIDWVHRTAKLGIHLGNERERGRGVGFVATSLLLDYAFAGLDLMRVGLTVVATNARAVRLYEKLGFVREGVERAAYFQGGQRHDVWCFGMLRTEWRGGLPAAARRLVGAEAQDGAKGAN